MKLLSVLPGVVTPFNPRQGLYELKKAGYNHLVMDFGMFLSTDEIKWMGKKRPGKDLSVRDRITEHPEKMLEYPVPLITEAAKNNLSFEMAIAPVHPYVFSKISEYAENFEFLLERVKDCIMLCEKASCPYLLVYPPTREQGRIEEVTAWYEELIPAAKEHKVIILISNQLKDMAGHLVKGLFSDPYQLSEWIEAENKKTGSEVFAAAFDMGSANICGQDSQEMLRVLKDKVKAVIIKENDGYREAAMIPFSNVTTKPDYMGLIRGLREIDFEGLLTLDISGTYGAYSPLIRSSVVTIGKTVGDYFIWQIGMEKGLKKYSQRVLFGAGNMCRNYMRCYGKDYPPLFTCDNNEKMWGKTFEGLEVKNPQALMDLPEDCVIYICNIYYNEIREQLHQMGVKNPIENFNDEYLPSFHEDRIAMRF